jgi:hypothetical protein
MSHDQMMGRLPWVSPSSISALVVLEPPPKGSSLRAEGTEVAQASVPDSTGRPAPHVQQLRHPNLRETMDCAILVG